MGPIEVSVSTPSELAAIAELADYLGVPADRIGLDHANGRVLVHPTARLGMRTYRYIQALSAHIYHRDGPFAEHYRRPDVPHDLDWLRDHIARTRPISTRNGEP